MFDFEKFLELQDVLDEQLISFEITSQQYKKVWSDLLTAFGFSEKDYERLIDERWFTKHKVTNRLLS